MVERLRIGFVGVGAMGQAAHLKNYAALPDCEVVAIAELRPQLARRVAAKYGVPNVYESAGEMLACETLDGIVAPQQFQFHGQVVTPLYSAGVPVFTEKPLAASVEVGERMLEALRSGGSWHMVGYHKRSDPAVMWAKAEIERLKSSGELGALRYVRILMPSGDWVQGGMSDVLFSDEPVPPPGADAPAADMDAATYEAYVSFVNYYIHQVNLMRHLIGEPYRVVYADPSGVMLATQGESGIAGTIEMTPYRTTLDWQESVLVAFERGWIKLDLPAPLVINRAGRVEAFYDVDEDATPRTLVPQLPSTHAMRQQAVNFLRAIRGESEPLCEAPEALDDLKVARDYIRLWKGA